MEYSKKYPSGLTLVAKQIDHAYTVVFGVYVDVGSVLEDEKTNGFSHFIEHLMFKGTNKRTALQISEELEDIGANINAFTSKENTCFYTKSSSGELEKCVDVLSDMYFNAQFPEEELDKERGVVLEEIKMCEDTPDDLVQDLISSALYFGQPMGQTILGLRDNIKYCDRHSIQNFKKKHYIPTKTVISVAGKFDFDQLDELVQKYFEDNFVGEFEEVAPVVEHTYCDKFLSAFKDIEQSHLQLSWGGVSIDSPKRQAISVLANILGGGMSSRLVQVIREQHGLAYSVFAYPSYYEKCGNFEIYVGCSPENNQKVCNLLQQVLVDLVANGVTEKELSRAKVQAVNALYMNAESNMTLMRLYGRCMLKSGTLYNVDEEIDAYTSLTVADVNAIAREIFAQKHASAYVGKQIDDCDAVSKIVVNA